MNSRKAMNVGSNLKKFVLLGTLAVLQPALLFAQSTAGDVVFRIGEFNRSSVELAPGRPTHPVNYIVSQSTAAKDWYASQSAVLPADAQSSNLDAAPRAITFTLPAQPAAHYKLHVAVLLENPAAPALSIVINGKRGLFYLHPKLDYNNGDPGSSSFNPVYSSADVEFILPDALLHAGSNTITLQAIEQADAEAPEANITYDAIELDKSSTAAPDYSATVEPTVFFKQVEGVLKEEMDAFVRYSRPIASGSTVQLTLANEQYTRDLTATENFGEQKIEFLVHEPTPNTSASLALNISGHPYSFTQTVSPQKHWTIFLVPHIHVDIGYSDYQAKVAAIQGRTIDEAMDMTAKHPEFRFSLDGEWDLQQFLDTRSSAEQHRVIAAIQNRQIYVPAQYVNLLTGLPSTETLIRSLYPSANFSRIFGTPLNYANITDVPSYSWSYPSILSAAGIHYLAAASNNYRAPVLLQGKLNESSPTWWVGPDGQRVLLWYSRHYHQMKTVFGLPPLVPAGHDMLPVFLQMFEHESYHASAAIVYGSQVENTDLFPQQAEIAGKWNSIYAYPHIQYTGFHDALMNIATQFGDSIPTIRGDGGPYWEDGAGSDAFYVAMERWTEPRAQTAEKFSTLTTVVNPLMRANTTELSHLWTDMVLMDEHTWDSSDSVNDHTSSEAKSQLAIKEQFAVNAAAETDFIVKRSMTNIVDAIPIAPGSLIIFNSLNWKRSGTVEVDLGNNNEIVDTVSNQVVPVELISSGNGFKHVRFAADDVPALGYKIFTMRRAEHTQPAPKPVAGNVLESPYYRVTLDPQSGAIRSVYDKQLQHELVNQSSPYRFGQYLYVSGGDKPPDSILSYSHVFPKPKLDVQPAHAGKLTSVVHTPTGDLARMQSEDVNTPTIETEVRLFNNEKKIEIVENVDKKEVISKEGVYFAFPFAMTAPQFQYEVQTGVVDPAHDMYPGAGHEWFTAQHWVSVQQGGVSATVMPLDAPLLTLGDINRGEWPESFGNRPGNIFSYVMNNYWDTNYRAGQGGHFTFHYVVTSAAATDAAQLSRIGWQEMTPLENDIVTGQDKAVTTRAAGECNTALTLDTHQASFIDVNDAHLLLETWKPAEDGNGTILRFLDFGGSERSVTVHSPYLHLSKVTQTDALERELAPLSLTGDNQFQFTLHPHEIYTVRLQSKPTTATPDCAGK